MAQTYAYSRYIAKLTVASTTGILADDYVTGATSGAVGIVLFVIDATHLDVAEMSATAFAPTENITTADSAITTSCTARAASTTTTLPPNIVLVEGSDATITNVFRHCADSGMGGVTNPSSTSQWLGLNAVVYIGRRGQAAATVALSQNELLDLATSGTKNSLRIIGGTTNKSTLRVGVAKYLDNLIANFPPLYTDSGSKIKFDGSGYQDGNAYYSDANGNLECYDSSLIGGSSYELAGKIYWNDVIVRDQVSYPQILSTATVYWNNLKGLHNLSYFTILAVSPSYCANISMNDNAGFIYAWCASYEIIVKGFVNYDDNGVANVESFANGGIGGGGNILHYVNSDTDEDNLDTTYVFDIECLYENTFKLTVVDSSGNPIQNAIVQLKNAYGNALWTKLTATLNGTLTPTAVTGILTPNNSEIADYGAIPSVIRIGTETMYANKTSGSSTSIDIQRGKEGTTAHRHKWSLTPVYKSGIALTDANGQINYDGTSVLMAIPHNVVYRIFGGSVVQLVTTAHTLTVSKAGYMRYKVPITISGKNGFDYRIKLINSPYANMGVEN